ncbi:MAG: hypothetical protein J7498_15370 [Sphingobium sp.]|nr:hypothetical protein [Sphingobium sp.]
MTQDQGRTSANNAGGTGGERHEDTGLAQAYQKAAPGDAYHERQDNLPKSAPRYSDAELSGIESGETGEETQKRDPTLVTTPEVPGVPMKDVVKPDAPVAGAATSGGKWSDAELNGIETGEMGRE